MLSNFHFSVLTAQQSVFFCLYHLRSKRSIAHDQRSIKDTRTPTLKTFQNLDTVRNYKQILQMDVFHLVNNIQV